MLSISAKNKSQAVMWRALNSPLCVSIRFCRLLSEELILNVFEVCFNVFIGTSGKYSLWVLESSDFGLTGFGS